MSKQEKTGTYSMRSNEISADLVWRLWCKIQEKRPLVHCITNIVTVNDCANILLAAGASPTMAHHPQEAAEVTAGCDSLVCNLGAMEALDAMAAAGKQAAALGHPVIFDPVGAAGASYRRNSLFSLLDQVPPFCIRGNYSEIRALTLKKSIGSGVDALEPDRETGGGVIRAQQAAQNLALQYRCIVIASGPTDVVTDGRRTFAVQNGSPWMAKITGTGCMSSALLGAFLAAEPSLEAAASSCVVMGLCGELAEQKTRMLHGGTGTFHICLLDAVSLLKKEMLDNAVKVARLCSAENLFADEL